MTTCELAPIRKQPVAGTCSNPVVGMRADEMHPVSIGVTIASTGPRNPRGLLICRVNGEWLSRASWGDSTRAGDVIEWYDMPQDREILRTVLSIAAMVFLPQLGLTKAGLFFATLGTQLAINVLLPPVGPSVPNSPGQTGESLSVSLQGNTGRLDEPIAKVCGRRETTPNFAGYPYFEFRPKEGESDPNLDNEQYYFALFAVSIDDCEIIPKIGNTPLSRFDDVLRAQYLAPGVLPTEVQANVQTAAEVSSQVLESGAYVGGFVACSPRRTCSAIGVDVSATRGLGKTSSLTVAWRVEARTINDFGQVLGPWTVIGTESRTAFTSTPQRWSSKYTVAPARYEVRVVRTDIKDTDPSALHEIAWIALRAYLAEPAPLNPNVAHFEVVLRASSQLSQTAAQQIRLIVKGKARTWSPTEGWSSSAVHTRNPFWWALDLLVSQTWGMSKDEDRIDIDSFYALALQADERQDRFDYVFGSTMDAWDALQLILRAGRARAFRRNGVISVARDEIAEGPGVTVFTPRNCKPRIQVEESHPTTRSPDGVIVEYEDHRTWEWTPIECPLPGVSLSDMQNPIRKRLDGIIGATHAEREGLYEAAALAYRTRRQTLVTEMQGVLPAFMSPVTVLPDVQGYGQSGDIVQWDQGSLTATLSEPPDFSSAPIYITLQRDDGTLTDPIPVSPGAQVGEVVLEDDPGFSPETQDGTRERTKFILGPLAGSADLVRVASITDGGITERGAQLYEISGVVDDDRVHMADLALLPGPGDVQDAPGDPDDSEDGEGGSGGGTLPLPRILNHAITCNPDANDIGSTPFAQFTLRNNGLLRIVIGTVDGDTTTNFTDEWVAFGEIEAAEAALFEVRVDVQLTFSNQGDESFTGTLGTWESLGTDRTWRLERLLDVVEYTNVWRRLNVQIRSADSLVVQDSAIMTLTIETIGGEGGA